MGNKRLLQARSSRRASTLNRNSTKSKRHCAQSIHNVFTTFAVRAILQASDNSPNGKHRQTQQMTDSKCLPVLLERNATTNATATTTATLRSTTGQHRHCCLNHSSHSRLYPFPSKRFHVLLNSLFKVLCNFPSRYLFAIGLAVIFEP
jgi:hypothetical protein